MTNNLRWTEQQLSNHRARAMQHAHVGGVEAGATITPVATGELRDHGMNKTEAEYAGMLEIRRQRGEVAWWKYEAVTLKLADSTRYTPDFMVMLADGRLEVHETKGGFIREDGWLKLKLAAEAFPFRFFLCQKMAKKAGGNWVFKEV